MSEIHSLRLTHLVIETILDALDRRAADVLDPDVRIDCKVAADIIRETLVIQHTGD